MVEIMKEEMNRSAFIAAITRELSTQSNGEDLNVIPDISAVEVSKKLYFDFPLLSSNDVNTLVKGIEAKHKAMSDDQCYPMNFGKKVLDNMMYLTQSKQAAEDRGFAQAMSKLASSVYISAPWSLLELDRKALTRVFRSHLDTDLGGNVFDGDELMPWNEILDSFSEFVCSGSASHICGIIPNDDGWCADALLSSGHVDNLCSMLSFMGDVMSMTAKNTGDDIDGPYSEINRSASNMNLKTSLVLRARQVAGSDGASEEKLARDKVFVDSAQRIWLHLAYLARDLVSHCPQLLEKYLCKILVATTRLSPSRGSSDTSSSYPTSSECMQALICSNLAVAVCSSSSTETQLVKASSREAYRAMLSGIGAEGGHGDGRVSLAGLVDIFGRMGRHSIDGGSEACSLLLDVCSLYLDGKDKRGVGVKMPAQLETMHSELLTSRAVVSLVEFFEVFLDSLSDDNDSGLSVKTLSFQTIERLALTFSTACLQSPETLTPFILRMPSFISSVDKIVAGWGQAPPPSMVSPIVALPLLVPLVIALEARPTEALAAMRAAFAKCVDMAILRIREASAVEAAAEAAAEAAKDIGGKNPDRSAKEEEEEEEEELEASRRAKAGHVPGLAASLGLLVSTESGGYRASQRAREIGSLKEGLMRLCGAIKSSGTKNSEVRRLSKDLQALLEGGVKKTD
jgi:hypothetical protein